MRGSNKRRRTLFGPAALHAFILLALLVSNATAQVGGPKDIKPVKAGEKRADAPPKAPASVSQHFEHEGIAVDFSVKSLPGDRAKDEGLVAGADALVTFNVTDARTKQPVTGLHPNAWINARKSEQATNAAQCKDEIRNFVGGMLSTRPDVDLNNYLLLTLNHDNTITVINPQVSFSKTKLESIVVLPGPGADWALGANKEFLYVTMPDQSGVAVVNTITRKLTATIRVGEKMKPVRVAIQPDGRYAWVGLDDSARVAVIDTATNRLAAVVDVGAGLHNLSFTPDSRFVYVTNSAADTVSAIDTNTFKKVADIGVGKTPVAVASSSASGLVYVAAINGASVSVIDPAKQRVVATVALKRGVVALRFEPRGRFAFAVNQLESTVSVIDASTNAVVNSATVVKDPDQVAFTKSYAYVRGTGSEKFTLLDLAEVTKKFSPVDIPAGQKPPSASAEEIGVASMLAPTPEGNGMMIANTPDMNVYFYVEGMMAPMGTFQNYKRRPHALMVIDRSLAEVTPGVYSTPVKLRSAGRFDVPVLIDQPLITNCFQLEVGESPDGEKGRAVASVAAEALFSGQRFKPGESVTLRFKLTDSVTKQPLTGLQDVRIIVFEPPGVWQQRQWAKEVGGGVYEVTQLFPRVGLYEVMVGVTSRGVSFADLPMIAVPVVKDAQRAVLTNAGEKKQAKQE
jgi:YVTN family beta-propeller protein